MKITKKNRIVAMVAVFAASLFYIIFVGKFEGLTSAKLSNKFEKIELSQEFDQLQIEENAKKITKLLSNSKFDQVAEMSEPTLKETLLTKSEETKKELETITKIMTKKGKVKTISVGNTDAYKIKENGSEFVLVNLKANYEKGKVKFLLYFNEKSELIAFKVN